MASKVKFDLGGQKKFGEKPAHIIKEIARNRIVISVTVLELYEFQTHILASEVIFDLGGQNSFWEKIANIIK